MSAPGLIARLRRRTRPNMEPETWDKTPRVPDELCQEAADRLTEALEALRWYQKQMCEGFCNDFPPGFDKPDMDLDCAGCRARAALAKLEGKE